MGATTSEIVCDLNIDGDDVSAVIDDLIQCGLIIDSGQRRPHPVTGELEVVWFASAAGKRAGHEIFLQRH